MPVSANPQLAHPRQFAATQHFGRFRSEADIGLMHAYRKRIYEYTPLAGDVKALSPRARGGLATFIHTGCVMCHNGVLVGGGMYRKFGVAEDYWTVTGSQTIDNGRADVTNTPDDIYVFRVASLRNVAMTAPYFHDGSVVLSGADMTQVVAAASRAL